MKRIPFGGLKLDAGDADVGLGAGDNEENPLRGIETAECPAGPDKEAHVTMKRIPFGGLKLNFNNFIPTQMPKRASDNEENPLRGIETPTRVIGRRKTSTNRDNEENPLRGIETQASSRALLSALWLTVTVTMKRIPFGGLKLSPPFGPQYMSSPSGQVARVTMKRIPFGRLKRSIYPSLIPLAGKRIDCDNEENPLRGIETRSHILCRRHSAGRQQT
jgi:hypothetical protein